VAETTVKTLLCCGFRRVGNATVQVYRCWWRICREINVFNVENVSLRGYKWNEAVSNRICNVSNEMCNTCATSYVTVDTSRSMAYLILKVYVNERIKTDLSKNDVYFTLNIILDCLNNYQNM
jgi:hypothetical protein